MHDIQAKKEIIRNQFSNRCDELSAIHSQNVTFSFSFVCPAYFFHMFSFALFIRCKRIVFIFMHETFALFGTTTRYFSQKQTLDQKNQPNVAENLWIKCQSNVENKSELLMDIRLWRMHFSTAKNGEFLGGTRARTPFCTSTQSKEEKQT